MTGRGRRETAVAGEPTWAERARTALALAPVASLFSRARRHGRALTVVGVEDRPDGRPVVGLDGGSPVVGQLASSPVGTLAVPGPAPYSALHLVGPLHPVRCERGPDRSYRLTPLSVRLVCGAVAAVVPTEEFLRANPDPLRDCAPRMLRHLEQAHGEDLLRCVRAHGHDVRAVVPRGLDRYGVELAAIELDGVRRLRLAFPGGPVRGVHQLAAGVLLPLTCRCDRD